MSNGKKRGSDGYKLQKGLTIEEIEELQNMVPKRRQEIESLDKINEFARVFQKSYNEKIKRFQSIANERKNIKENNIKIGRQKVKAHWAIKRAEEYEQLEDKANKEGLTKKEEKRMKNLEFKNEIRDFSMDSEKVREQYKELDEQKEDYSVVEEEVKEEDEKIEFDSKIGKFYIKFSELYNNRDNIQDYIQEKYIEKAKKEQEKLESGKEKEHIDIDNRYAMADGLKRTVEGIKDSKYPIQFSMDSEGNVFITHIN